MEKYTILEYSKKINKTKQAILYQIKKWNIKASKDNKGHWVIYHQEDENNTNDTFLELHKQISTLESKLDSKDEIILELRNSKNELNKSNEQQIKILLGAFSELKEINKSQKLLLIENSKNIDNWFFSKIFNFIRKK